MQNCTGRQCPPQPISIIRQNVMWPMLFAGAERKIAIILYRLESRLFPFLSLCFPFSLLHLLLLLLLLYTHFTSERYIRAYNFSQLFRRYYRKDIVVDCYLLSFKRGCVCVCVYLCTVSRTPFVKVP